MCRGGGFGLVPATTLFRSCIEVISCVGWDMSEMFFLLQHSLL